MKASSPNSNVTLSPTKARSILALWLGEGVVCTEVKRLHGGACYAVMRLRFDRPPHEAVVKLDIDPENDGFARERRHLDYVHRRTGFPAPEIYFEDNSCRQVPWRFLLLEALPGVNLASAGLSPTEQAEIDRELADTLLELHSHTRETFGEVDRSGGSPRWTDIFLPKLADLRQDMNGRFPRATLSDLDEALRPAEETLADFGPPTLVHGDVWAGNIVVVERQDGWHLSGIVDLPALQYADVEYELAYLQAWETVTPAFFDRYTAARPLRPGYDVRRMFYHLHTYMLHVWLFEEDQYRRRVADTAKRIREVL